MEASRDAYDPQTLTDQLPEFEDSPALAEGKLHGLGRLNELRTQARVGDLRLDDLACRVASAHAREMLTLDFESNFNRAGEAPYHRWAAQDGHAHVQELVATVEIPFPDGRLNEEPRLKPPHVRQLIDTWLARLSERKIGRDWGFLTHAMFTHVGYGFAGSMTRKGVENNFVARMSLLLVSRHVTPLSPPKRVRAGLRIHGEIQKPGLKVKGAWVHHDPPLKRRSVDSLAISGPAKNGVGDAVFIPAGRFKARPTDPPQFDIAVPLPQQSAGSYHVILALTDEAASGEPTEVMATSIVLPVAGGGEDALAVPVTNRIERIKSRRAGGPSVMPGTPSGARQPSSRPLTPSLGPIDADAAPMALDQVVLKPPGRRQGPGGGFQPRDPHWKRSGPAFTGQDTVGNWSDLPPGVDPRSGYLGQYMTFADALPILNLKTSLLRSINAFRVQHGGSPLVLSLMGIRVANMFATWMAEDNSVEDVDDEGMTMYQRFVLGGQHGLAYPVVHAWEDRARMTEEDPSVTEVTNALMAQQRALQRQGDSRAVIADPDHTHVGIGLAYTHTVLDGKPALRYRYIELYIKQYVRFTEPPTALEGPALRLTGKILRRGILPQGVRLTHIPVPSRGRGGIGTAGRVLVDLPMARLKVTEKAHPNFEFMLPITDRLLQPGLYQIEMLVKRYGEGKIPGGALLYLKR